MRIDDQGSRASAQATATDGRTFRRVAVLGAGLLLAMSACVAAPSPSATELAASQPAASPLASGPSASSEPVVGPDGGTVEGPDGPRVIPSGEVTATFTVGGTVNGLAGTLVLENHRGLFLEVTEDGPFTFTDVPTPAGEPYFVKVFNQPFQPQQTCTVTNGEGTFTDHDVTDVAVECV